MSFFFGVGVWVRLRKTAMVEAPRFRTYQAWRKGKPPENDPSTSKTAI